jgi:DNA invertase Pin-like site-specific DNA recombinase
VGLTGQNANQCNADILGVYGAEAAPKARIRTVKQRQVRLTEAQILKLVEARESGRTINQLAESFEIHRTTVMRHLQRSSLNR